MLYYGRQSSIDKYRVMVGKVWYCMCQVGAATETELEDRKLRIEDAKNATFAAVEEGIVPGGGAVFLHLSELVGGFKDTLTNGEEQLGADIVFKSLSVGTVHSGAGLG
jgi:chaperonin GroEL (HSP60 family)